MSAIVENLAQHFRSDIAGRPKRYYFAPGRVNLIGEYTDFNGGWVMPCAIQYGTYLILVENGHDYFNFHSMNDSLHIKLSIEEVLSTEHNMDHFGWVNYPLGVIKQYLKQYEASFLGRKNKGFDFYFFGNLPIGAGLSSSASIEVVCAFALNDILDTKLSLSEIALLAQKAENEFVGVNCGIMDQFAIVHGKQSMGLMINCSSLSFDYVNCNFNDYQFLIIYSGKNRVLSESRYNQRRQESARLIMLINQNIQNQSPISDLCQLVPEQLDEISSFIPDPILKKRLKHIVNENQAVVHFKQALENKDFIAAGELMNSSHHSLKNNYQVTGEALDSLVEIAQSFDEVLGARMTGAGFGGCTINLIKTDDIEILYEKIRDRYQQQNHYQCQMILVQPCSGVRKLSGMSS